ncbi:hypothetical protein F2S72_01845 [Pseudomonas syringae pv. actinidiae]|nr:hypothetical protein [Pseudomonas syringae pv. actinidiae]
MDSQFAEWLYLQQIVGNFNGLVQYYFGSAAFFGPWFRQAGVGVLYSMGLAWAGFCFIKAPVDRLQHGLVVLGMVILSGFLLSPTKNTKELGAYSGTELSVGGYYSYYMAGTMSSVFSNVLGAAWKNSIVESVGGGGPTKDAVALAFNDQAVKFAERFIKGEGSKAYVDYFKQCGSQALAAAKTPQEKAILKSVGVGAATLGMSAEEADTQRQIYERQKAGSLDFAGIATQAGIADGGPLAGLMMAQQEAKMFDENRAKAKQFMNEMPNSNNSIDGTVGYRIPSATYYKTLLSDSDGTQTSTTPMYKAVSSSGGDFSKMLPNGATTTTAGGEDDYIFYPKNCSDLYEVANATMASLRQGAKSVPGYENLPQAGGVVAMTAANLVDRGIKDQMGELAKQAGVDMKFDDSVWENTVNNFKGAMDEIGNKYNNWMLKYQIPFTIASMAMIVAILLITFPIFACISVIFGVGTLKTYFKLMAFPFLVVFVNNLLLILAANAIAFNKSMKAQQDTFIVGGVDLSNAIASMNTETVIYTVICVAEVAIAKLILWDDVKAVTSMNLKSAAGSASERGMSIAGQVVSLVGGAFGRVGKLAGAAKASKHAESARQTTSHIASISQSVSAIAARGGQIGQQMGGQSPKGQGGNPNQPGGSPKGGGGSPSLNPPKTP